MGQQMPDGDVALAVPLESRQVGRHAVGEPEPPLLDQLHHGRGGGDDFGQRGQVEDRIHGHGLDGGLQGAAAEDALVGDGVALADQDDRPGQQARRHGLLDEGVDSGEAGGVEAEGVGRLSHRRKAGKKHGQSGGRERLNLHGTPSPGKWPGLAATSKLAYAWGVYLDL